MSGATVRAIARPMPGTAHARIGRKIINFDKGGEYVSCAWDTCDRDANQLYEIRWHEHAIPKSPRNCELVEAAGGAMGHHIMYAFCSESHKEYWINATGGFALESLARSGRAYGNRPAGSRNRDRL